MSNDDRIGNVIQHVRRASRERGDIYLFYIDGRFKYVPLYPAQNKDYDNTRCFGSLYAHHPKRYIGCYNDTVTCQDLRDDIEDFLDQLNGD